eukprot:UN03646
MFSICQLIICLLLLLFLHYQHCSLITNDYISSIFCCYVCTHPQHYPYFLILFFFTLPENQNYFSSSFFIIIPHVTNFCFHCVDH